jgi:hypothetical protein
MENEKGQNLNKSSKKNRWGRIVHFFKSYFAKLKGLYCRFPESKNGHALTIAGIHATILSILIGFLSGYYFYVNSKIYDLEKDAIDIASDINKIERSSNWNKLIHASHWFLEKWPKNVVPDKGPIEFWLGELIMHSSDDIYNFIPISNPIKTYRDMGFNLTEIKLCLMASIFWQTPFAKVMREKKPGETKYDYRVFRDKEDVDAWVKDTDQLFRLVEALRFRGTESFLNGFDWNSEINLQKRFHNIDQPMSQKEKQEFMKLPQEFVKELFFVWDASRNVASKLNRIDFLRKSSPSNCIFKILIVSSLVLFFMSVIVPLFLVSIRSLWIVWFPFVFYVIVAAYFTYNLLI